MSASSSTSLTIGVEETSALGTVRVEIRCARCERPVHPRAGVYVLRMAVAADNASVRFDVASPDGAQWPLLSGADLAEFVRALGHSHGDDGV